MLFAIHNPAPAVIVLVSGDGDFSYALSLLNGLQYTIVLVVNSPKAPPILQNAAKHVLLWRLDVLKVDVEPPAQETGAEAEVESQLSPPLSSLTSIPSIHLLQHSNSADHRAGTAFSTLTPTPHFTNNSDIDDVASQNEEENFSDLLEVLRNFSHEGIVRPQRSKVQARLLNRNPLLYQRESGLKSFKQYSTAAEKAGYVTLGGVLAGAWISLAE